MADCLIGLGSNVGDRVALLDQAIQRICDGTQIMLCGVSQYHETPPIGGPAGQGPFLNAAIRVTTALSPEQSLALLRGVERDLGRERLERWGPRSIDIDLLLYDARIIATPELALPHPRMAVRRFVLAPACEVGPEMIHAPTGWPLQRLLARLDEPPCYVAVCCAEQRSSTALVMAATEQLHATQLSLGPQQLATTATETSHSVLREALAAVAQHSQLLEAVTASPVQEGIFLSDFWLNQSLALARTWPPGPARQQLEQACHNAIDRAPQPRFILHLGVTRSGAPQQRRRDAAATSGCDILPQQPSGLSAGNVPPHPAPSSLAAQLLCQVAVPGQGPVLSVAADDLEMALVELRAGIDAMR